MGCHALTSIEIPDSVTSIGNNAFDGSALKSIALPKNLTKIGSNAFAYCDIMGATTIPENVESIGTNAFYRCNDITSVTIENPDCVIGESVDTFYETVKIQGYEDSTAQAYAEKYNREFVSIGEDTTTTTPPVTTEPYFILGDINADGSVDSSDASLVLAEYAKIQTGGAGEFTKTQLESADVNNDNVVDSSDASKILAYYAMVSTGKKPTWD